MEADFEYGSSRFSFSKPWYNCHTVKLSDVSSGLCVRFVRTEQFNGPAKISREGDLIPLDDLELKHVNWLLGVYSFEQCAKYTYGPEGLMGPRNGRIAIPGDENWE